MMTDMQTVILMLYISSAMAYLHYQDAIPNGDVIPYPGKPNHLWQGVGHKNPLGAGVRNPFGVNFAENGHVWSNSLCNMDSDQDGRTNGEELGDPSCIWTPGDIPSATTGLSHPGVCEPVDSVLCQQVNDWEINTDTEFTCPSKDVAGVTSIDLLMDQVSVPDTETTYMCMTFDLPSETSYHIIADEPIVDNANAVHHMLIYGCSSLDAEMNSPRDCGMAEDACRHILTLWSVGILGNCHNDNYGFKIGQGGYTKVLLQIHYNNPEMVNHWTDHSGMRLHYTSDLRPNDAGTMMVGQMLLGLPPGMSQFETTGYCDGSCTESLPGQIFLAQSYLHMHYLGRGGQVLHKRGGQTLKKLVDDTTYSYDNPKLQRFVPEVEFEPGDSLEVTCQFKTSSKRSYTYYGESTSDEMCFIFFIYYPWNARFDQCLSYNYQPLCEEAKFDAQNNIFGDCCQYSEFFEGAAVQSLLYELFLVCQEDVCTSACKEVIQQLRTYDCLSGPIAHVTESIFADDSYEGKIGVTYLHSCDDELSNDTPKTDQVWSSENWSTAHCVNRDSSSQTFTASVLYVLLSSLITMRSLPVIC